MSKPILKFTPNINPTKPILLEIGGTKYRFTADGLSSLQDAIDRVYSEMCDYMENVLQLSPGDFLKKDYHYKCPYCKEKVGGISKGGAMAIDTKCPACQKDLTSKFVDIMSQPYNGL